MRLFNTQVYFSALYLLIFAVHFGFALWIVWSKRFSLALQFPPSNGPTSQGTTSTESSSTASSASLHRGVAVLNRILASPMGILLGLTLLNLPSVLVFWRSELLQYLGDGPHSGDGAFHILLSPAAHAFYHIVLAFDEWLRAKIVSLRWVFLVNHLLWSVLLASF